MKAQHVFRIVRNAGLTLLAVWIVIWAYFYFSHSSVFWEREKTTKSIKSAGMPREKATAAAEQVRPKEPPFYQPVEGDTGCIDPDKPDEVLEIDAIEGIVEKIDGRIITVKLDHIRCDDSGRVIKPGVSGYDTAYKSAKVEVPGDFNNIFVQAAIGKWEPEYRSFENIQIEQRLGIVWVRPAESQEAFKLKFLMISP